MHDMKMLHENIFRRDAEVRPKEVDKLLNDYQKLSTANKKEFINLFFNEKVYDTSKIEESGALVIILTGKELA